MSSQPRSALLLAAALALGATLSTATQAQQATEPPVRVNAGTAGHGEESTTELGSVRP